MEKSELLLLSDYAGQEGAAAGGAGIAVMDSFRALRAARLRTHLVTGFGVPDTLSGDADVRSLGGNDLRAGSTFTAWKTIYNPLSRRALSSVLAAHDPDRTIIVLHQWTRYLTPSAIALLRPFRLMIVMHDYFWACPNGSYFDFGSGKPCERRPLGVSCITAACDRSGYLHKTARIAREVVRRLAFRDLRHRPIYLHVSEQSRRIAAPLLHDGVHAILHNPFRAGHPLDIAPPKTDFDIGYVGRLEPQKGIATLVETLRRRGLKGLFVGEGTLDRQIDDTPGMTRLPWQAHADVSGVMRRCRALALPSLWPETWGLVTAEAMMAGVPVLVSSRAGSAELVERFGGGLIFDPGSSYGLDRAIDQILSGRAPAPLVASRKARLKDMLSPAHHAATLAQIVERNWGVAIAAQPTPLLEPA